MTLRRYMKEDNINSCMIAGSLYARADGIHRGWIGDVRFECGRLSGIQVRVCRWTLHALHAYKFMVRAI
jgi:hypothetical protein